jgi:predicted nucleotidyltransferase
MLRKLFSSKVRIELMNTLFSSPDRAFYARELSRMTREDYRNVFRELKNLEEVGLVNSRRDGNRKYFRLNQSFSLYSELKSIFLKTKGAVGLLKDLLSTQKGIEAALLYGSFASGTEAEKSDIDFMIIGSISVDQILKLLREPEKVLAREINPSVFTVSEIHKRMKNRDSFVAQVLSGPKIMLIGSEDDLRRIAG